MAASPEHLIRRMLDISTAHLPSAYVTQLESHPNIRAWTLAFEDGAYLMYCPDETADEIPEDVPEEVKHVMRFARLHGCAYVMFDVDSEIAPGLPFFDY